MTPDHSQEVGGATCYETICFKRKEFCVLVWVRLTLKFPRVFFRNVVETITILWVHSSTPLLNSLNYRKIDYETIILLQWNKKVTGSMLTIVLQQSEDRTMC